MIKNKLSVYVNDILSFDEQSAFEYKWYLHVFALLLPIVFLWMQYHDVTSFWWMGDDPVILWSTIQKGIFPHFYKPEVWRSFSPSNLTPWVQLSFGIDWKLFGLHPVGFYWHQLISFTLVLIAAYGVLRLNFHPLFASFILILFTFSVPSSAAVQTLMVRHYLEGMGLALCAYYCYVKSDRSNQYRWAIIGGIFYLLAVTAKEIYVPLVAALPFISISFGKKHIKLMLPYIFVACFYVLWRAYMLNFGNMLTGYQYIATPGLNDFLIFPKMFSKLMGWNYFWQKASIITGSLIVLASVNKLSLHSAGTSILWFLIIFIPIVPVIPILDLRYLFLPSFMLFIFIGHNIQKIWNDNTPHGLFRVGMVFLMGMLFISVSITNHFAKNEAVADQYRKEGKFVLYHSDEQAALANPIGTPWYYLGLKWLRQNILKKSSGPTICYNADYCETSNHVKVYQYKNHDFCETGWPAKEEIHERVNSDAELSLYISYKSGLLQWKFGPYNNGIYKLLTFDALNKIYGYFIQLPRQKATALQLQSPMRFKLKYESPDGWETFSPALVLDPNLIDNNGLAEIQWKRD